MNYALRMTHCVCILLVLGLVAGCGDDNPSNVTPPDNTNVGGTIHKVDEGATACAFRIEAPTGWTLVSAQSEFPVSVGDIEDGISVAYGQCLNGTIRVMTLTYGAPGNSTTDARFRVLPNSQWPDRVQVVDCNQNLVDDGRGLDSPVVLPQEGQNGGSQGRPKSRQD
jgi:hypothetical protein